MFCKGWVFNEHSGGEQALFLAFPIFLLRNSYRRSTILFKKITGDGYIYFFFVFTKSLWDPAINRLNNSLTKKILDKTSKLDYSKTVKLADCTKIFKALSNEQRLRIFMMLYKNCCVPKGSRVMAEFRIKGESCCGSGAGLDKAFTKICDCMKLSRSTISHHFKELQNAGLITCEREGQLYRCRVNKDAVDSIKSFLE